MASMSAFSILSTGAEGADNSMGGKLRNAIVVLMQSNSQHQSALVKVLVIGPLLLASWSAVGSVLVESVSVVLVSSLLALGWGVSLIVITGALYLDKAGTDPIGAGLRAREGNDPTIVTTSALSAGGRTRRTLQSFAAPTEPTEPVGDASERIRLPLRG